MQDFGNNGAMLISIFSIPDTDVIDVNFDVINISKDIFHYFLGKVGQLFL
jgi:hypothetical protein